MVLRRRKGADPFFVADAMAGEVEGVVTVVGDIAAVGFNGVPGSERVVAALLVLRGVVDSVIDGQVLR